MDLKKISKEIGGVPDVAGPAPASPPPTRESAPDADRVDLSSEAREVLSGFETARALDGTPAAAREERIAEVRERVTERYYDRPEVRKDIVTRLLQALLGLGRR
jgi:hypothetical protein